MKKVLIITYYWPPAGGPAVQRWVKFVKYLPEFGWKPIVYVPENPDYPVLDHSFNADLPGDLEVLKKPIWEPYDLYRRFLGLEKNENFNQGGFIQEKQTPRLKDKMANFIRSNFFIPDARRFWIGPSVKYLKNYLEANPVDLIVTTGPPHSLHLIGHKLKNKLHISWLADFRDPWTNIYYFDDLLLIPWVKRLHENQEKNVLKEADKVVTVGNTIAREFSESSGREIEVITNGFDPDDFHNISYRQHSDIQEPTFNLVHTGNISQSKNNPVFWEAISELLAEFPGLQKDMSIQLVGNIDYSVNESIKKHHLEKLVERIGFLPHEKVISFQKNAQLLLLFISNTRAAKGAVSGRIFEYLASGRPIMAIAHPEGDLAEVIQECTEDKVIDFTDKEGMKRVIRDYYHLYRQKGNISSRQDKTYMKFSRPSLTRKLVRLFDEIF